EPGRDAELVLELDRPRELLEVGPRVRDEEVAARREARPQPGPEPLAQIAVGAERLAGHLAVDPCAPLLADAARLDAGCLRRDSAPLEHDDLEAALGEVVRDGEADHARADDRDVLHGVSLREPTPRRSRGEARGDVEPP